MTPDFCGRCLIIVSAAAVVCVTYNRQTITCPNPTPPKALEAWAERHCKLSGGDARFEIDATTDTLLPFSTWHGDPVCAWHLSVLVDKERRGH